MNVLRSVIAILMLGIAIQPVFAEQKKTLGRWDVHYIALNTTFLTPQVAKTYDITRSGNRALVNISVLDRQTQEAQQVTMTGKVRDLLGTTRELTFKQVTEDEAIYYLASFPFEDNEHYRFTVVIEQNDQRQTLKFEHKLYTE